MFQEENITTFGAPEFGPDNYLNGLLDGDGFGDGFMYHDVSYNGDGVGEGFHYNTLQGDEHSHGY